MSTQHIERFRLKVSISKIRAEKDCANLQKFLDEENSGHTFTFISNNRKLFLRLDVYNKHKRQREDKNEESKKEEEEEEFKEESKDLKEEEENVDPVPSSFYSPVFSHLPLHHFLFPSHNPAHKAITWEYIQESLDKDLLSSTLYEKLPRETYYVLREAILEGHSR
jgi:hypothetical protein